jgi:hypothetical protein
VSAKFRFDGLADLYAALKTLPEDLARDAAPDVERFGEGAMTNIHNGYPSVTGGLRAGLSLNISTEGGRARVEVRNDAPHAILFERGTEVRHWRSGKGTGRTAPNPIFTATMMRARRGLLTGPVPQLLVTYGMEVRGVP